MDIANVIKSSNIEEIGREIRKCANSGEYVENLELVMESDEVIPVGYYSFSIENFDFVDCFVYPSAKGEFKGILQSVKIKVEE